MRPGNMSPPPLSPGSPSLLPLLYPAAPHSSAPTASSSLCSSTSMQQQQQRPQPEQQSLSISTFNILAPCYKRMQDGGREADFPEYMERRAIDTATFIREELDTDIICLQEFFMHDEAYTSLFHSTLADVYDFYLHPRPSKKDGLGVLLKKGKFRVHAVRGATLSRWGSRVGLLMDLEAAVDEKMGQKATGEGQRVVLLSTHLSFPHNRFDENQQHRQVLSLTRMLETYVKGQEAVNGRQRMLQVLCGDFNVDLTHPVLDPIHALGFRHVMAAGESRGVGAEDVGQPLVTHRTHRGEDVAVDHIFFRSYDSTMARRRPSVVGKGELEDGKVIRPLATASSSFSSSFLQSLWSGRRGAGGDSERGEGQEKKEEGDGKETRGAAPGIMGGVGQRRWTEFVPASSWCREKRRERAMPHSFSSFSSPISPSPSASSVVWGRERGGAAECVDALLPSVEVVDVALYPPSLCSRKWPKEFGERISDHRPLKAALNVTRIM
ncbi:calcium-binding protein at1g02270-like isoform x2 [Nannochloropsis oceanica]